MFISKSKHDVLSPCMYIQICHISCVDVSPLAWNPCQASGLLYLLYSATLKNQLLLPRTLLI